MKAPARKLTRTYVLALSLIAILGVIGQTLIHYALNEQEADARVINISGRQRMLSQKITKNALLLQQAKDLITFEQVKSDFEMAYTLWDVSHQGLTLGDGRLAIPENYNSETVQQLFEKTKVPYQKIRAAGQRILNLSFKDTTTLKAAVEEILAYEDAFLVVMNQITFQYEAESEAKVAYTKKVELGLFFATLFVLLLEVIFVFQPAVRKVRQLFDLARAQHGTLAFQLDQLKDSEKELLQQKVALKAEDGHITHKSTSIKIAQRLLNMGLDHKLVAEATELSFREIERLDNR